MHMISLQMFTFKTEVTSNHDLKIGEKQWRIQGFIFFLKRGGGGGPGAVYFFRSWDRFDSPSHIPCAFVAIVENNILKHADYNKVNAC